MSTYLRSFALASLLGLVTSACSDAGSSGDPDPSGDAGTAGTNAAGAGQGGASQAGAAGATAGQGGKAGPAGQGGKAGGGTSGQGGTSAGGANTGGANGPGGAGSSAGGANAAGANAGGANAGGANAGGASAGGQSAGGTDAGGQSAGGQSAGGNGGTSVGGTDAGGQSAGGNGQAGTGAGGQTGAGPGGGEAQAGQGGTTAGTGGGAGAGTAGTGTAGSGTAGTGTAGSGTAGTGAAGTGGSAPTCPVVTRTGPFVPGDALDFLVQDVCLDGLGNVTADDPATCACRRDLALDEALPYHKGDSPDGGNPYGFQISDSFPMRLAGGSVGALHSFDFGFGEVPGTHLRAFFEFDDKGGFGAAKPTSGFPTDGYDLLEQNGALISIITTCDGGGGVQPMWAWKDNNPQACQLEDAWLLFDRNQVSSSLAHTTAHLRINAPSQTCPHDKLNSAYTDWQQRDVTYTTGKTLSTLVASHYGGEAPETADHIERFYLTREYGKARWERWNLTAPANDPNCSGPKQETHGNRTFYMIDCRDWTHVLADPRGGFEPRTWPVDLRAGRGNLLINGDFGAGTDYLGPWERFTPDVNLSIVEINDPSRMDHRNRHLALSWNGSNLPSVHQDLDNPSLPAGTVVDFGARVWSDSASALNLQVFQFDGKGALLDSASLPAPTDATQRRVAGSFVVAAGAKKFRVEAYQSTANVVHHLDDAWLTPH